MAKKQERAVNVKYGICTNTGGKTDGTPCSKCQNKDIQAIRVSKDFVCEECGETLTKVDYKPPRKWPVKAIIIALVVIGCGIGAYFIMRGMSKHESITITLNTDTLTLKVDDCETLTPTISTQPKDAEVALSFMSDNVGVAKVDNNGVVQAVSKGETNITVIAKMESGVADTVHVNIIVNVVTENTVSPNQPDTNGNGGRTGSTNVSKIQGAYNLGWGTYNGEMRNGKPHGKGTVRITQTHTIDLVDITGSKITVYPGETIKAMFDNGRLRGGDIIHKDGSSTTFVNNI